MAVDGSKVAEVLVKSFKIICPVCESSQFSISGGGVVGRPKEWGPEVLGVADCRGCQQVFLVKVPPELAMHLLHLVLPAVREQNVVLLREALGLR
jgi:hypothetical protein